MNDGTDTRWADVIDLAALSHTAKQVVEIYDRLRRGEPAEPGVLDAALSELDDQRRLPGKLGDDIELLTSGGVGGTRQNVISAIERLRRVSSMQPRRPKSTPSRWQARKRRGQAQQDSDQLQLPGIESGTEAAS